MNVEKESKQNYACLDLARGLAALAVAASHLRAFVLVDASSVENLSGLWKIFYLFTGLGHQAVMVFFVMSGFLVGKHVHQAFGENRWSWTDYAIKRLSRLWIVLLPALFLTACWDAIGINIFHASLYQGAFNEAYHSTPKIQDVGHLYSFGTAIGNAFFLQTITVPPFGTNGPMWSLSNEFWYYVVFPLCYFVMWKRASILSRVGAGCLALSLCCILPIQLVLYGVIWLFGFGVVLIDAYFTYRVSRRLHRMLASLVGALFLTTVAGPKLLRIDGAAPDFACGIAFAGFLYFLTKSHISNRFISHGAKISSELSYTLYLTHFSMLALVSCTLLKNVRLQPSSSALTIYIGLLSVTILYAYSIYCIFERNTKRLQTTLLNRFNSSGRLSANAAGASRFVA